MTTPEAAPAATTVPTGAAVTTGWGPLLVLAASVLWGTTGTAATFAPGVGPLAIGAAAMGVGGLLQAAIAARAIRRDATVLRTRVAVLLVGGLAVAVYPLAFYTSMALAGVTVGTVVSLGSAPLAAAVIERVADRHPLTARWATGAAFGVVGAVLLCVAEGLAHEGGAASASGSTRDTVVGVLLGLVAGVTYATYSYTARRLMAGGASTRSAMGATFGVGGLLLLPVLAVTGAPLLASPGNLAVGAYMALVPMFAGYVLFGLGLARVRASTATTITLSEPVVAAVLAVLVVGERLPALGWAGIALIGVALVVLTVPVRRRVR